MHCSDREYIKSALRQHGVTLKLYRGTFEHALPLRTVNVFNGRQIGIVNEARRSTELLPLVALNLGWG